MATVIWMQFERTFPRIVTWFQTSVKSSNTGHTWKIWGCFPKSTHWETVDLEWIGLLWPKVGLIIWLNGFGWAEDGRHLGRFCHVLKLVTDLTQSWVQKWPRTYTQRIRLRIWPITLGQDFDPTRGKSSSKLSKMMTCLSSSPCQNIHANLLCQNNWSNLGWKQPNLFKMTAKQHLGQKSTKLGQKGTNKIWGVIYWVIYITPNVGSNE